MKNIFFLLSIGLFISGCYPVGMINVNDVVNSQNRNPSTNLNHQYQGTSNANTDSAFSLVDRKIEFEFASIVKDSLADVLIMLTSGYNEGEIVDHMIIHLNDGSEIIGKYTSQSSREYVENYSYNTSIPVTRTKTINDPGGTDIVVQPDGTHQHVHRPASSKMVTVNETDTQTNYGEKSQLFNTGTIELNQENILAIKTSGIKRFEILLENCEVDIKLSSRNNKAIIARL